MRILSADPALPYAKPPLSKEYLCGRQANLDLHSAGWFERNDVDLIRGVTVDRIDVDAREVITAGGVHYPYWHLVLAPGSAAVPLAVPGGDLAQPLRSFADAVALKMAARHAETAVVVGAGLIGCEAAACLAGLGVATTIVAPEIVPLQRRFGVDVGERVVKMLSDAGVRFIGASSVAAVEDTGVLLASGESVDGDVVVAATGVRPDIRLATAAGLATPKTAASSSTSTCAPRTETSMPQAMSRSRTTSPQAGPSSPSTGATPPSRASSPVSPPPAFRSPGTRSPDSLVR